MNHPRSLEQRKADTLALLASRVDVWLASAGERAHLVPLSFLWNGEIIALANPGTSITTKNLREKPHARLAFGDVRDVVMVDAVVDRISPLHDEPELIAQFQQRHNQDPRTWGEGYVFLVLRPERIQAWREANELAGRTLLRDGRWLA